MKNKVRTACILCAAVSILPHLTPRPISAEDRLLKPGVDGVADLPAPRDVEQSAVAARRSIRFGRLDSAMKSKSLRHEFEFSIHFEFDFRTTRKLRMETLRKNPRMHSSGQPATVKGGDSIERLVINGERYIYYSPNVLTVAGAPDRECAAEIGILNEQPSIELLIMNPLLFGMIPIETAVFNRETTEGFLTAPGRRDFAIKSVILDNARCYQVDCVTGSGLEVREWIAPERGYSLLKVQGRRAAENGNPGCEIEWNSRVKHYPKQQIWFPEEITYRDELNGMPNQSESIVITNADFSTPPDFARFELTELGIRPGSWVSELPRHGQYGRRWNGKELEDIVPPKATAKKPLSVRPNDRGRTWFIMSCASAGLALLCALLARRRFKTRGHP